MKIILPTAFALVLFATLSFAESITCARGSVKYLDKPNSVTITCLAPVGKTVIRRKIARRG